MVVPAGMRGMIALSIEVKGPSRDLHSGNEGGELLANPWSPISLRKRTCNAVHPMNKLLPCQATLFCIQQNQQSQGFSRDGSPYLSMTRAFV